MSGRKHSVKVRIVGEEYAIRSEAPPEHTRAVAEYLDRAIREVMGSGGVVETHRAAMLAALQITDELLKARQDAVALDGAMRGLSTEVKRWLPPAKRAVALDGSEGAEG